MRIHAVIAVGTIILMSATKAQMVGFLPDSDSDGLPDVWEQGVGRYQVVQGNYNWEQAKIDAEVKGGHLATFTSAAEWQAFLTNYGNSLASPVRIGMEASSATASGYRWVTDESGMFFNWAPQQPNGGFETTVVVYGQTSDRVWHDFDTLNQFPYVLEFGYPTDPFNADSDGDGFNDKVESDNGSDPNNAGATPILTDRDKDGVNYYREISDGTNPTNAQSFSPLSKGLAAYYPFYGTADDVSGYSNNFSSSPIYGTDRHGLETNSATFSSTNPISSSTFTNNGQFTATFWLKLTNTPSIYGERVLLNGSYNVSWNDASCASFGICVWHDGKIALSWLNSGRTGQEILLPPGTIASDKWYQVFFTADATNVTLGLNAQTYGTEPGTLASVTNPISLGGEADYYFDSGLVDDVRLYNRALAADEIAALYYSEAFTSEQKSFLVSVPSVMGHYSQSAYEASRTNGQVDVMTNPSAFNLFTQNELENFGALQFTNGQTSVMTNVSEFGLITQLDHALAVTNSYVQGVADVTNSPSVFNLFTAEQYTASYSNGVSAGTAAVLSNPASYSLYDSNSIMDLAIGALMIQKQGTNATVVFQPQSTTDLATLPFTNNGTPITNTIPMPGNKGFLRVRGVGGSFPGGVGPGGGAGND